MTYQFTNDKSGDEEIHRAEGFTDWAWSDPEQAARVRQRVQDEQYRVWVKSLGGEDMTLDTQKIIALIGAVVVGIAFLFVVIAPAFPTVIVPQGTANVVFGLFGIVFGYSAAQFQQNQTTANIMKAQGK